MVCGTYGGGRSDFEVHGFKDEIGGVSQLDNLATHQTQLRAKGGRG